MDVFQTKGVTPPATPLRFLWYMAKLDIWRVSAVTGCFYVAMIFEGLLPYVTKLFIDALSVASTVGFWSSIQWPLTVIGFQIGIPLILWRLGEWINIGSLTFLEREAVLSLLPHTLRHSHRYFSDALSGEIGQKITAVRDGVFELYEDIRWRMSERIAYIVIPTVLIVITSPLVGSILIGWFAVYIWVFVWRMRTHMGLLEAFYAAMSRSSGRIVDAFSGATTVKQFAAEAHETEDIGKQLTIQLRADILSWRHGFFTRLFQHVMLSGLILGLIIVSAYQYSQGVLTIGSIALLLQSIAMIWGNIWSVSGSIMGVFKNYAKTHDALKTLLVPNELIDNSNAQPLVLATPRVEFSHVGFAYIAERPVIQDFSLTINPGESVAFVGASGAGKTTLFALLLRYYDVTSGSIHLGGVDIRTITQESLRQHIAVIPQEGSLFHRSVRDNIAYGKPDATQEEIETAAKRAHAHDFIMQLSEGYNSIVGERGIKLSGGQRQRIAIARAILKNAPILLLDEATSALDSVSERHIQSALLDAMQGKTVIAVAHRLSTIMHMNRIVVLNHGKLEEMGTHEELLAKNGHYRKLWDIQVGGFLGDTE